MLRTRSSQLSFYGNHIYDRVIPEDHFLKLLNKVVDFSFVNDLCRDAYTPTFGRPACGPEMMFKIIFLVKNNRKSPRLRKHQMKPEIIAAQRERPKIERKFAELKRFHGLKEAPYWGLTKMAIQFIMTAIACKVSFERSKEI